MITVGMDQERPIVIAKQAIIHTSRLMAERD
jgi:hypothetical protein